MHILLLAALWSYRTSATPLGSYTCTKRFGVDVREEGNVAFLTFKRPGTAVAVSGPRIVPLSADWANRIFDLLLAGITAANPRAVETMVDITGRVWMWNGRGERGDLLIWFQRGGDDLHVTGAFVRRPMDGQQLIISSRARLDQLERALKFAMRDGQTRIEDDPRVFDRLPRLTDGFAL